MRFLRLGLLWLLLALSGLLSHCGPSQLPVYFFYPPSHPELNTRITRYEIKARNLASPQKTPGGSFPRGEEFPLPEALGCTDPNLPQQWELLVSGVNKKKEPLVSGRHLVQRPCHRPAPLYIFLSPVGAFSSLALPPPSPPPAGAPRPLKLLSPRIGHRVTGLPDGRLLISGGFRPPTTMRIRDLGAGRLPPGALFLPQTEIYDPGQGTLRYGPSLLQPRAFHTATLLPDGSLWLTGGLTARSDGTLRALSSTEQLLPQGEGEAKKGPPLAQPRVFHSAALLPAKAPALFLFGGLHYARENARPALSPSWEVLPLSHSTSAPSKRVVPLAREQRRAFHTTTPLVTPPTTTPPLPWLVITGGVGVGRDKTFHSLSSVLHVFFAGGRPHLLPLPQRSLAHPRAAHTATPLLDGRVVIAGGLHVQNADNPLLPSKTLDSYELLSPQGQPGALLPQNQPTAPLPPRALHSALLLPQGQLLLAGGLQWRQNRYQTLPQALLLHPNDKGELQQKGSPPLQTPRFGQQALLLSNHLALLLGGATLYYDAKSSSSRLETTPQVESYNPGPSPP